MKRSCYCRKTDGAHIMGPGCPEYVEESNDQQVYEFEEYPNPPRIASHNEVFLAGMRGERKLVVAWLRSEANDMEEGVERDSQLALADMIEREEHVTATRKGTES